MSIGVLVYRGVTTADIDVPVTRLAERLSADVVFVGTEHGRVPGVEPSRDVVVDLAPAAAYQPEVLVVPGGLGWRHVLSDEATVAWLTTVGQRARGILAISTGSLLVAAVGLLDGRDATGHWLASRDLAGFGANVMPDRVATADQGRLVTAAGASAAMAVVDEFADCLNWSGGD
jgi:transcriptional regulator GlxA family with amidase domain